MQLTQVETPRVNSQVPLGTAPVSAFAQLDDVILTEGHLASGQTSNYYLPQRAQDGGAPVYTPAGSDFDSAVAEAARMSSLLRTSGGWNWSGNPNADHATGSRPLAVVQSASGAYAITPLATDRGSIFVFLDATARAARLELRGDDGRSTFGRAHVALQAIVGSDQWIDLRNTTVGSSATSVDLKS